MESPGKRLKGNVPSGQAIDMDHLQEMDTSPLTGSARQASDNTAIDCNDCSPAPAADVKEKDLPEELADFTESQQPRQPRQPASTGTWKVEATVRRMQNKRMRRKRWALTASVALLLLLLVALPCATLVLQVFHNRLHHHQQQKCPEREPEGPEEATTASSSVPPKPLEQELRMDWIQVSIDMLAVANCTSPRSSGPRDVPLMPCKINSRYIASDAEALAPLRCVDDAFLENPASENHCDAESTRSSFQLLAVEGRVRVTRPGLYLLIVHVTVRLREAAELHFGVAVNRQLPFLCTVQSYGSRPGEDQPVPYSHCSVKGLRRLRAGDEVWLMLPQANVPLQSLYRSTFLQIARLSR